MTEPGPKAASISTIRTDPLRMRNIERAGSPILNRTSPDRYRCRVISGMSHSRERSPREACRTRRVKRHIWTRRRQFTGRRRVWRMRTG
jgi:hypothetical protein